MHTLSPLNNPILFLLILLLTFWSAALVGVRLRGTYVAAADKIRSYFAIILGAALTLLGLIIGFSFSMAVNRYDQRKTYEEQEANAIGTEYLRVGLLPADDAAKAQTLLRTYLDERIRFYDTHNELQLVEIANRTAQLQSDLWSSVAPSAKTMPPPIAVLILSGMNEVLNSQGYTQAAWRNRIPGAAWLLLVTISILCNFLIGYDAPVKGWHYLVILPIALSVSLFLIADIDSPRHGIILVRPQNLSTLANSLRPQSNK